MEAAATGGGGSSSVGSGSVVVEQHNHNHNHHHHHDSMEEGCDESELELGLGLSLGVLGSNNYNQIPRTTFTPKDLPSLVSSPVVLPPSPSSASSCSSLGLTTQQPGARNTSGNNISVGGTKRAASPTAASQVVGWPPIRAYRMNSMANQSKSIAAGENNSQLEENKGKDAIYGTGNKGKSNPEDRVSGKSSLFVKVNMVGVAIGRKVDLNAHSSYESLAQTLEDMFTNKAVEIANNLSESNGNELVLLPKVTRPSKLLDGSSEYVLTYEDKDGDWMLVGDVPWGMFLASVKRLRIMRTSEANGLAPRSEERSSKQRSRPI